MVHHDDIGRPYEYWYPTFSHILTHSHTFYTLLSLSLSYHVFIYSTPKTAEIISQFQNKEIQAKWQQLQNDILSNHNNRQAKNELRKLQVEHQIHEWREQNEFVQQQLDEKVEMLRNRFTDVEFALEHDVRKLEQRLDSTVPKVSTWHHSTYY